MKHKKTRVDPQALYKQEFARGQRWRAWVDRHALLVLGVVGLLFVAVAAAGFTLRTQLPFAMQVMSDQGDHRIDSPIVVHFDQMVRPDFVATVQPQAKGQWQVAHGLFGVAALRFVPEPGGLAPDANYTVNITGLQRITGQQLPDVAFSIATEAAPTITEVTPKDQSQNVAINTDITVALERSNRGLRKLRAVVEAAPELIMLPPENNDSLYRWRPTQALTQGHLFTLNIYDDHSLEPAKPVHTQSFTTVAEPQITNATNKDHFYPEETIDVHFNMPMKQDQPGLVCQCNGSGKWVSDTQFQFKPAVEVAQTYKYTVPAGLSSVYGGVRETAAHYEIKTPGAVTASFRALGGNAPTNAEITVYFDQAVEKPSAEARFSLAPSLNGTFRWPNATTMIFTPQGLEAQTGYRASIAPGVKPVRFGLDSAAAFGTSFTTAAPSIKLGVPLYRQQHRSSCEAAALRMALAYRGIGDSDINIVQRMGYNGRHKDQATNSWDDPYEMYVGDVNGLQSAFQGYGAYAPPIAKAAQSYGRGASSHYGVSASFIAEQIYAGNPVIIIGTVSGMAPRYTTWNGPNGQVHAWIGEHARTVIGVTGKPSAPISFIVNDPNTGSQLTWSPARLMADINAIPQIASQVVVVH